MNQLAIFWPAIALMGWTFLVLLLIPYRRFKAFFAGQVSAADFRCGESDSVPDYIRVPNRVFMNLLEMPVFFYVLITILYVTNRVDGLFLGLAWAYLALRVVHSLIYLTYNHVMHRFFAFAVSNVIILVIWIRLIIAFA